MRSIPAVPKPESPAFFDLVITEVQDALADKLSWLDYSFGRSQNLVRDKGNREYRYPAVHIRNNDYQSVEPNNELGNFSFFILKDPQVVDFNPHIYNKISSNYALVFWLNLDDIFPDSTERNTEALKAEILKVLTRELVCLYGRLTVTNIQEEPNNIYREYSLKEVDSQYLMQPYAGFRFEGNLIINEVCVTSSTIIYLKDSNGNYVLDPQGNKIPVTH